MPERVVRHLEVERFACFDLPGHEIHPALGHSEELFRVGIRDVVRTTVVGRTVAFVKSMLARVNAPDMPFSEMGGRVAVRLEELGDRRFAGGKFDRAVGGKEFAVSGSSVVRFSLAHECHVEGRRAFPGEDRGARRRASRRGRVEIREPHPAVCEGLEVRGDGVRALRCGHGVIHLHRRAAPAVALAEDDDKVRLLRCEREGCGEEDGAESSWSIYHGCEGSEVFRTRRTKLLMRMTSPCGPRPCGNIAGSPDLGSLRCAPAPWTSTK